MDLDRALLQLLNSSAVRLPPFPATPFKLNRVLADPDHHRHQVVELVRADAPLAAAVLRVANSAMWAGASEVTTLPAAIGRIGESELQRLALAEGLSGTLNPTGPLSRIGRRVWHDSVSAAVCGSLIAPSLGLDREELFVAGLLHDLGRMLALHALEGLLRQRPPEAPRPPAHWWALVDRYHVELGLLLARSWKLPDVFIDCICLHHQAFPGGRFARQVRAVAAVDQLVDVLNAGLPLTAPVVALLSLDGVAADPGRLAAALAEAPGMIAGFEDPHVHDRGSMVSGDAAPITVVPPRVPMTFHLDTGAAAACWSAQATEVAFTVPTPMAEGFVQRVEVALPGRRFPLWLRVATATPVAGGYAVVGQPFALSGPSLEAWLAATG